MSLTSSLYTSFAGLRNTESQITVSSNNVTNADKAGYTRKEYTPEYAISGIGSIPVSGNVEITLFDPYLQETVIEDTATANRSTTIADYLDRYADRLGNLAGGSTLSSSLDDLASALDQLSVTPEDNALKGRVINAAEQLALQMRQLSSSVQDLRGDADREIDESVTNINNALSEIDRLNKEISLANATGRSVADLTDERNLALERLAKEIDVNYFYNSDDQLHIYTGGQALLTANPHPLSFTPTSASFDSTAVYPGGLSGITVDGKDITTSIDGGRLSGLLDIRDTTLVEEQAKLDNFADTLSTEMNTLMNAGASYTARPDMTGDTDSLTGATALTASGSVRIALTDVSGTITNVADINLGGFATVTDLINGINAALGPDLTASLSSNGELVLAANNAGEGISLNQLNSDMGSGDSFGLFFGLNNMFTSDLSASDITVSSYLQNGSEYLPTGVLSTTAVIGDIGVSPGDGSQAKAMNELLTTPVSFAAAGNFGAQNETLDVYADKIMSDAANRADNAAKNAETVSFLLDQTKSTLDNMTGVNIDEEMTKIVDLQARYQSAATVISTISQLFDELIAAVR